MTGREHLAYTHFVRSRHPHAGCWKWEKGGWSIYAENSSGKGELGRSDESEADAWRIAAENLGWGSVPHLVTEAGSFFSDMVNFLPDGEDEMQALRDAFTPDMVNHPPHYQSEKGIECIDAIEAAMTVDEFRGYLRGNCLKYLWRAEKKGRDEDIKKAAWYLNKLIETPKS